MGGNLDGRRIGVVHSLSLVSTNNVTVARLRQEVFNKGVWLLSPMAIAVQGKRVGSAVTQS